MIGARWRGLVIEAMRLGQQIAPQQLQGHAIQFPTLSAAVERLFLKDVMHQEIRVADWIRGRGHRLRFLLKVERRKQWS
jgi:hypothetical protein